MRALIVYESMFGNTQRIADAIAEGLGRHGRVEVVEVSQAILPVPHDLDLLVIGGPTHAFSMSRPTTRQSAKQQAVGPLISGGSGIREWIARLAATGRKVDTAVFDTRLGKPMWTTGSAARSAAKHLKRSGIPLTAPAASFTVTATTGPLGDGELARARQWGETLGQVITSATAGCA